MEVYVLMFGFEYDGYSEDVKVFTSISAAIAEGDRMTEVDEDGLSTYDFYVIKEVEVL